ncbi:hypothetical protein DL769_004067 [Monosporascus sp. CRB-8-3]|nr:hypothetical protein DL769_004067 [Monosporascus sp. CRB-8-3]
MSTTILSVRDGMVLGAALSNLEIEFIDGVNGKDVPDKALPLGLEQKRLPDAVVGSWRAHLNAIQENLTTALILEDDADWDVRIRDQLRDFALSSTTLTQPLVGASGTGTKYADQSFPRPLKDSPATVQELSFGKLPATTAPKTSPYGDNWDVIWAGHCGMHFPFAHGEIIPKGRVVQTDQIVPQKQHLWTLSEPDDLKEQYPDHTRVVHHVQDGICSLAYAVTQKGARQLLYELGLKDANAAFDVQLRWFCEGTGRPTRGRHHCLTMQPPLFGIHLSAGAKSANSDISDHGEGYQEEATKVVRWSVRMNAEALIEDRTDFVDQWPDVVEE